MFIIKTLKGKIATTYVFLVFFIAMIGVISSINIYKLSKTIDGLMTDNYKSIVAANDMGDSIDEQDKAILQYFQSKDKEAVDLFYSSSDEFYKWFNVEDNNITEVGERDLVEKIKKDYIDFEKVSFSIQDKENNKDSINTTEYYKTTIIPKINQVKKDLSNLKDINEKAMFKGKNDARTKAEMSLYIILIISSLAAIAGLIVSMLYTNKALAPIYLLTETIKSVKEGEIYKQAPVVYEDEVGMLSREFNSMTKRLYEFEQSTLGRLLAEKKKSLTIVKSISDPLIVMDESYKITLINKSCERLFNIKEDKVINTHLLEAIKNVELYDYVFSVISNNIAENEKVVNINIKETSYYFNIAVTAVKHKDGRINSIVVLFTNVTAYKQLEKLRTDFIATISHELKTPLTSIMMGAGLLHDKNIGHLNEKQGKILDTIKDEVYKLTDLVSNLLKLSKLQSEKAIFDIKACSIFGIIENSIKNYIDQAYDNEVKLLNECDDTLPKVKVDSEKITWVINNLISNALKYTNAGDEIIVGAYIENNKMNVFVKDTGKGIPQEFSNKIFEKFVKIDSLGTEFVSTGLGLSIAKEIVEAHEGSIICESKIDEGSKFTFTLPIE